MKTALQDHFRDLVLEELLRLQIRSMNVGGDEKSATPYHQVKSILLNLFMQGPTTFWMGESLTEVAKLINSNLAFRGFVFDLYLQLANLSNSLDTELQEFESSTCALLDAMSASEMLSEEMISMHAVDLELTKKRFEKEFWIAVVYLTILSLDGTDLFNPDSQKEPSP